MTRGRVWRAGAGPALVAVFTVTARADAPTNQYELFGPQTAEIQDHYTHLFWERSPPATRLTFDGAQTRCAGLSLGSHLMGWRVPSYKELLTLVDETPNVLYPAGLPVAAAIDSRAFGNTSTDAPYWSSSLYPKVTRTAYAVDFADGRPSTEGVGIMLYARCVHDPP